MKGAVDSVRSNFATIRTGRANPTLLDRIEVEVYGSRMPLRSVANVGAPEPRLLVTPFDPNSLKNIERGIRDSDIGLNPQNDGKILRLPIPELTEERRRELIRLARSMAEEGRVSVRNVRRDEMRDVHELRKEGLPGRRAPRRGGVAEAHQRLHTAHRRHPRGQRSGAPGGLGAGTCPKTSRRAARPHPRRRGRVPLRGRDHGRQRALGQRRKLPRAAGHRAGVEVLTPLLGRGQGRCKDPHPLRLLDRELGSPRGRGGHIDALPRDGLREGARPERARRPPEVSRTPPASTFICPRGHAEAEELTAHNDKLDVYVALNYGGRSEIVDAAGA